jgi:hypothetical protein
MICCLSALHCTKSVAVAYILQIIPIDHTGPHGSTLINMKSSSPQIIQRTTNLNHHDSISLCDNYDQIRDIDQVMSGEVMKHYASYLNCANLQTTGVNYAQPLFVATPRGEEAMGTMKNWVILNETRTPPNVK